MSWQVMALDANVLVDVADSTLSLNGVPLTDDDGWISVPLTPELQETLREDDLRARLVIRFGTQGRPLLCVDALRFRGDEFKTMHALGFAKGGAWVRYVPEMIRQRVAAHCAIFATVDAPARRAERQPTGRFSALRGPTMPDP